MTNEIKLFEFKDNQVRVVLDESGEPWFVAKDVCECLGLSDTSKAVSALEGDEADTKNIRTRSDNGVEQTRDLLVITESGLYSLVLRSNKEEAKVFKRWVTHDVLPSIRRHGAYMNESVIERTLSDPDYLIRLATTLKEERQKRLAAEEQIELDRPKTIFADSVRASSSSILIGQLAKILTQNGYGIGQNRLFAWLREHNYLCRKGEKWNQPTQWAMDNGWFELKESTVNNPDGSVRVNITTKVTGKGQIYFINLFLDRVKAA